MTSDILLKPYFGGLGDSLQFSTLPEEFFKQQGKITYLLSGANFNNKEIYDLVWGLNPYIKGIKDGEWGAGDLPKFDVNNNTNNWISNWEYLHGLEPTNIRPKIYYKPNLIDGLKDSILVDLSSVSLNHNNMDTGYNLDEVERSYRKFKENNLDKKFSVIKFKSDISNINRYVPEHDDVIEVESIYHYCDLIYSSYAICGFHSGLIVLAASIQRYNKDLNINCIVSPVLYDKMMGWVNNTTRLGAFYLDYVNYIVTN